MTTMETVGVLGAAVDSADKVETYWDGKLIHLGHSSVVPGKCFRLCENTGDPYQVKADGQGVANAVPTCLRCITWVQDD